MLLLDFSGVRTLTGLFETWWCDCSTNCPCYVLKSLQETLYHHLPAAACFSLMLKWALQGWAAAGVQVRLQSPGSEAGWVHVPCCLPPGAALLPGVPLPFSVSAGAGGTPGRTHLLPHIPGRKMVITLIKESSWGIKWCFDIVEMMKLFNIQAVIPQPFPTHRNPWLEHILCCTDS